MIVERKEKTSERNRGAIFVIIAGIIFGLMPLMARQIYELGSNPVTLTLHRFLFSIPFLFVLAKSTRADFALTKPYIRWVFLLALGFAPTSFLLYASYNYISSGVATTIHFIYPVLVLLGCVVVYRERLDRTQMIGAILSLLGVLSFLELKDGLALKGLFLAFLSGVTLTFYVIYLAKGKVKAVNQYELACLLSVASVIILFIPALFTNNLTNNLTFFGWGYTLFFAIATSGVAIVLFQIGVEKIGPQRASLLSTMEPVTGVVVGILFLGELLTLRTFMGILLILAATTLIALKKSG